VGGLDHHSADSDEVFCELTITRNSRYGLMLFAVYSIVYGGFVWLNAFRPDWAEATPVPGVNVAVLYGFALIVAAFVLALVYGWLCRKAVAADGVPNGEDVE
jgi:uncharacterized membrane protein (DUF485 family)